MTEYELACERSDPDWPDRARVLAHGVGTEQVPRQLDLFEGERLRDEGMARVTSASDERVVSLVDTLIRAFNRDGERWSVNDLREFMQRYHPDILEARPQLMGARVRAAAMRKEMRRSGYTPSTLPSTHAHPIAVWRGVRS